MSGEVTDEVIDLGTAEFGMFLRIITDRRRKLTLYPTVVRAPFSDDFATNIAVTGLDGVGDHTQTLITRTITRGVELRVKSRDGIFDYRLGKIVMIVAGNY